MLMNISNAHSLFYGHDEHVTQFRQFTEQLQPVIHLTLPHKKAVTTQEAATIYNIWLLFNKQRYDIYFDEDRRFTHSAHRYFYENLQHHPLIASRIASAKDEREVYVLAYFLGIGLCRWMLELFERRHKMHLQLFVASPSYYTTREHTLTALEFESWLNAQKELTMLVQQDQKHENSLRHYIHDALGRTQQICTTTIFIES